MNVAEAIRTVHLFSGCTPGQVDQLAKHAEVVTCRRYEEIYREESPARYVHAVLNGEVCLEKDRGEGAEPMRLTIVRAGEVFGLGEFMLPTTYTSATALTNCELLRISNDDFRRQFLAIESIRDNVVSALSYIARYLMFSVVAGTGTRLLACYLWRLCRDEAEEIDGKFHIKTKVRQPEVASLLNMSREHVTRLFAKLHEDGFVDFNRGYPVVDKQWLIEAVPDPDLAERIFYRDYPQ